MCLHCLKSLNFVRALKEFSRPGRYAPEVSRVQKVLLLRAQIFLGLLCCLIATQKCKFDEEAASEGGMFDINMTFVNTALRAELAARIAWPFIGAAFILASVWFPWVAEYFIIVPILFGSVSPCMAVPTKADFDKFGSPVYANTLSLMIMLGFVCKKHLLVAVLTPSMYLIMPTYSVSDEKLKEMVKIVLIAISLSLATLFAAYTGLFRMIRLQGTSRTRSEFNQRIMNSAPLGILILASKPPTTE